MPHPVVVIIAMVCPESCSYHLQETAQRSARVAVFLASSLLFTCDAVLCTTSQISSYRAVCCRLSPSLLLSCRPTVTWDLRSVRIHELQMNTWIYVNLNNIWICMHCKELWEKNSVRWQTMKRKNFLFTLKYWILSAGKLLALLLQTVFWCHCKRPAKDRSFYSDWLLL